MRTGIAIILSLSLTACSHLMKPKTPPNLTLHRHLSPKALPHSTKGVIDKTFLQTEADYHYSLGEVISLEGDFEGAIEEFKLSIDI